jgi:4-aminobutyrate aminotransferase-like enzyme
MKRLGVDLGTSLVGSLAQTIAKASSAKEPLEHVIREVVGGFASEVDMRMNVPDLLNNVRSSLSSERVKELDENRSELERVATRALNMLPNDTPDEDASLLLRRRKVMGEKMKLFFDPKPQHFVRGLGMELYDSTGKRFYDFYNNVVSVGHCHPFVVGVLAKQVCVDSDCCICCVLKKQKQAKVLNTNTRYLGDQTVQYAEQVLATLDPSLDSIIYCNSGSEANDIAYRLCVAVTNNTGGLTMRHAYHGITDAMTGFTPALSPNCGQPHVRQLEPPHDFAGPYRRGNPKIAELYAATIDEHIEWLKQNGYGIAAAIADSMFMSNGVLDAPKGYLQSLCAKTRAAGGLYIADEVQAGFNRSGETMWGHQRHGVVPDIVTIGKPAGNGHPLSAVITRKELLQKFSAKSSFFSTFGGNNVACAVGMAVLQVMREEQLLDNARQMGAVFKRGLEELKEVLKKKNKKNNQN